MPPFIKTVPHFRIIFDNVNKVLNFQDLIQSGYSNYGTLTAFQGLIKIADPYGTVTYQNTGFNLTAPDFSSPDIEGNTPTWEMDNIPITQTSGGLITPGLWTFWYITTMNGGTTFFVIQKTYNFDYISPVVYIDLVASCKTSQLFESDTTDVDVNSNGQSYAPTSFTRLNTIEKPLGSGANDPGSTSDQQRVIGGGNTDATRLWTRVWQNTISLALQYDLAVWDSLQWVRVLDTISGSDDLDVRCDDEYCNLRQCVENLYNYWQNSLKASLSVNADTLSMKVLAVTALWQLYEMAERCGVDTNLYISSIKKILGSLDCSFNFNPDDSSHVVYAIGTAIGGGGSGGTLPTISEGTDFPTGGIPGSLYIWYDSKTNPTYTWICYNSGGTWIQVVDILGQKGNNGNDGNNNSSANLLFSDLGDNPTPAGTGETTLSSFSVPGSTLVNVGDYLELIAVFSLASNANEKTMSLYFGGDLLCQFVTDPLIDTSNNCIVLSARIHKVSGTSEKIDAYINNRPVPVLTSAKDLSGAITVSCSGQNGVASANDIILKSFDVILFSVLQTIPTSLRNWDMGSMSLIADTWTPVTYDVTMPSTYNPTLTAFDVDGNPIEVMLKPGSMTTTQMIVQTIVNTTLYWKVEAK